METKPMKKILFLSTILLLALGLASCKDKVRDPEAITAYIVNETVLIKQITVHVVVPVTTTDVNDITEIVFNIGSQIYEKHFVTIGTDRYTLTVYIYRSEALYEIDSFFGYQEFKINKDLEHPGLSYDDLIFIVT
jgi:hypothetical protein